MGAIAIDEELADLFIKSDLIVDAPQAHRVEHSLEVQIPLIQRLLPEAKVVPINVQPCPESVEVGKYCATRSRSVERDVAFVGSTDLTHYGPAFGFESHGRGVAGVRWAKEVNDRRFVSLISAMKAEELVPEATSHRNACGPGAIAALVSAMRELGLTEYEELQHTCSAEVKGAIDSREEDSVGYESGVFRAPSAAQT
jgi:AmmeMemoRadiSam system protein B